VDSEHASSDRTHDPRELADLVSAALSTARVFALPLRDRFRGITERTGVLLSGPAGWGEFAPFAEYSDAQCVPWLESALEAALIGWPPFRRASVPVNVTVPVVDPDRAATLVAASGCSTAKVKVAGPGDFAETLAADAVRIRAVREALGNGGAIRVDANGAWTVAEAVRALSTLELAAAGLEYAEQPCRSIAELAEVRRSVQIPIAADESIRLADDPERVALAEAADIAVLKVAPLGGVRRALRVASRSGLRIVVSSAVDTSVGLAAGLALAAASPDLTLACGLGTATMLVRDVCSDPLTPLKGQLRVRSTATAPDLLAETVASAEITAYWQARLNRVAQLLSRRDGPPSG
jgi:O-succinylbenzoate synthase